MSYRALFIRAASGLAFAGLVAVEANAQQQVPIQSCKPLEMLMTSCDGDKPVAIFNSCSIIDISVFAFNPNTGTFSAMILQDRADTLSMSDDAELKALIEQAQSSGYSNDVIEELQAGRQAIDRVKREGLCAKPSS